MALCATTGALLSSYLLGDLEQLLVFHAFFGSSFAFQKCHGKDTADTRMPTFFLKIKALVFR